jgi:hypothetical protein
MLAGVCERLAPHVGPPDIIIIRHQQVIMVVLHLKGYFLAVTLNIHDADALREVLDALQTPNHVPARS